MCTRDYYARIAALVGPFINTSQLISLVDLCRVAFIKREASRDVGGDGIVKQSAELFSNYTESPAATEWHWHRLIASEATAIIALGTIAEHGLLRLFTRRLSNVSIRDSLDGKINFKSNSNDNKWPSRYAHLSRKLKDRVASAAPPYWEIQGNLSDGRKRIWRVAVVHHPTGCWTNNADYHTRAVKAILNIAEAAKSSA